MKDESNSFLVLVSYSCVPFADQNEVSGMKVLKVEGLSGAKININVFSKAVSTSKHHSRFLSFYYFLHCRYVLKTSELWRKMYGIMWASKKVWNNPYYVWHFRVLKVVCFDCFDNSFCTLLAFSLWASWHHLMVLTLLVKSYSWNFLAFYCGWDHRLCHAQVCLVHGIQFMVRTNQLRKKNPQ